MQTTETCESVSGNDPFTVNTSGFADPWQNFEFFCDLYNSPGSAKAGGIVGSRHTYLKLPSQEGSWLCQCPITYCIQSILTKPYMQ